MAEIRECEVCGQQYEAAKPWARFCSGRCRTRAHRQAQLDDNPSGALIRTMRHAARTLELGEDATDALAEVERELKRWNAHRNAQESKPTKRRASADSRQPSLFGGDDDGASDDGAGLLERFEDALAAGYSAAAIGRDLGLRDGSTFSRWRSGRRGLSSRLSKGLDAWLASNGF